MELDDNIKRLLKELGEAIDKSVANSDRVADVMSRMHDVGYDVLLLLEVTIGVGKRGEVNVVHRQKVNAESRPEPHFHLTTQDTQFLRALKIVVDEDLDS